ncbi:HNH endonuclease [Vibrio rotiferianus]|uniref:HNH endonuclease n=1 Tax=Vibrio rotiferianus TaxID=190895 RepID=UPI0011104631|nr:HNH endonuclease signature motif containing protein [Vibrio rotiferianus]TMX39731.1 HNH endonuclease [Vibrio rotiferianus]TMX59129.1 HNH endonuclease [Vibrio rotiferianus]TMX66374.1 HNH endonuclease [Vibrio rotiferianus]
MAYYWVNIGDSHEEVEKHNFLWAPEYGINKNGKRFVDAGWKPVPKVKSGDVIICHNNKHVVYLAQATSNAYPHQRPDTRTYDKWKNEGFKIEINLIVLPRPINNAEFKDEIIDRFNSSCVPKLFTSRREVGENYMISIPEAVADIVLSAVGDAALQIKRPSRTNEETAKKKTRKRKADVEREKQTIVNARVGQGQFRKDVLELWNNTCPVTQVAMPELLIASHIVSWALSDDDEKIDGYNGLPLSPNVDKLFDKGLISFTDNGEILISPSLPLETLQALGINKNTVITGLTEEHAYYLGRHREIYGF